MARISSGGKVARQTRYKSYTVKPRGRVRQQKSSSTVTKNKRGPRRILRLW